MAPRTITKPSMDADDDKNFDIDDPLKQKAPSKLGFLLHQIAGWHVYVLLTLVVLILSLLYVICMCFIVFPIAALTCKFRELPSFFSAPVRLQAELFRKYRHKFNYRNAEWDLEKSKPKPIPRLRRRTLSIHSGVVQQTSSPLFSKLPAEIRLYIYGLAIARDRKHLHITVHRSQDPKSNKSTSKIRGVPCQESPCLPTKDCKCFNIKHHCRSMPFCTIPIMGGLEFRGRGDLALLKTCRQVYMETVDMLYSKLCI